MISPPAFDLFRKQPIETQTLAGVQTYPGWRLGGFAAIQHPANAGVWLIVHVRTGMAMPHGVSTPEAAAAAIEDVLKLRNDWDQDDLTQPWWGELVGWVNSYLVPRGVQLAGRELVEQQIRANEGIEL